jgi:hypothetical protein
MSLVGKLYNASRTLGDAASKLYDVETLLSGNPEKIIKRNIRKTVSKHFAKVSRRINRKIK